MTIADFAIAASICTAQVNKRYSKYHLPFLNFAPQFKCHYLHFSMWPTYHHFIVVILCQVVGFDLSKYPNIKSWYHRAKENMSGFEEVNEKGAQMLGDVFKKNLS